MTSSCFDQGGTGRRGICGHRGHPEPRRVAAWAGCAMALPLLVSIVGAAAAQNIVAYPSRGQTQEQQQRDRFECYNWAEQQTGFNPQAQTGSTAPPPPTGGPLRRHEMEKEEAQAQSQQSAAVAQKTANFNHAMGLCLRGRGYTVE